MADNDIAKMKVADLKRELKLRALATTGNKNDLIERLQASLLDGDATLDESVLNSDDILDDDVLNDDELDDETKSLLDSNHEDAVLKTPPESVKSKSPDTSIDPIIQHKKVVLKRKLNVSISSFEPVSSATPTESEVTLPKLSKTTISAPTAILRTTDTADSGLTAQDKQIVKLSQLSATERLEMRAKKFGASDATKIARSERLGTSNATASNAPNVKGVGDPATVDILKKRAERFGGSVSKVMNKIENLEKLQKRQERFGKEGATKASSTLTVDFAEKARLRLERFKPAVK